MSSIATITTLEGDVFDIRASGIPYGRCDSTSTSTAFTATVPGVTSLHDGVCALLKNGVVTSEEGFTININGLGAKPVYSSMAAATRVSTVFNVNYTMLLVYDETRASGGCWVAYYGYYTSSNSIGYQVRTNSTVRNTTDAFRYYKILFSSTDNTKWVPAASSTTNSATSAKTVNQRPINPFGEIVYCSASTSYAANAAVSATAVWQQYTLTLGYSFNRTGAALVLTTKKPVYVKCDPQSDGSAIIDADTPYVQDLPSTADGKIYIWLGIAYSATQIELTVNHPVFYHDGTGIRIWTGKNIPSTAADVGAVAADQGSGNAGKFLVVGNDGIIVPVTAAAWQGGMFLYADFDKTASENIGYEEIYIIDAQWDDIIATFMRGGNIRIMLRTSWDYDTQLSTPINLYTITVNEQDSENYPNGLMFGDSQYRTGFVSPITSGANAGKAMVETASNFNTHYSPGGGGMG